MDFSQLRAKAEAAAGNARATIPSKPAQRYEPVRPNLAAPLRYPSQPERRDQSTVLQLDASRRVLPPPPRRVNNAGSVSDLAVPPPSYTAVTPSVAESSPRPPPPLPPAKRAPVPTSAPPPRAPKPAALGPASSRTSSTAAVSSFIPGPASSRPVPTPPYSYAFSHELPAAAPGPALPARASAFHSAPAPRTGPSGYKRFTEYGEQEKSDLFATLDSFFGSRLEIPTASSNPRESDSNLAEEPARQDPLSQALAPPPVAVNSHPRHLGPSSTPSHVLKPQIPASKPREWHGPSYPPVESHSSAALSLLHYVMETPFSTPWFVHSSAPGFSPLPPPLADRTDLRFTASWSQRGSHKTHVGVALFGDLSVAWWRISWTVEAEMAGRAHLEAIREGRYRPRPDISNWDAHALYEQSESIGVQVARFAEEATRRGVPVARGECWDLAHEALDAVAGEHKPLPSIGRTHGALLYYARSGRDGTWTGGDAYVRPGDVVEWRLVEISEVGASRGERMTLGDPDHTAVILSASAPSAPPSLGPSPPYRDPSYPLASLTALTVAEQSLGQTPTVRTYDLATMTQGEIWIYRPCAMRELCGIAEIEAVWPEDRGIECWGLGDLE